MGIPVSFEGVETRSFEPLPVARYSCKVTALDYVAESARSGEPSLAWQFTVQGGEYDGRIAFLNTSLQPQSLWSTMRILIALGLAEEEVRSREWDFEDPEVIDLLLGNDCDVVIGHQMYEGEKRQRVRRVLSPSGAEPGTDVPF
ncbi:MAG: hypothetical protein DDT34_02150 [Firmicutes bacterium]|nr:hypothetical protein [Bacillota bacterium]